MGPPCRFPADFPREIRDQIYSYVLTPVPGPTQASPWTVDLTLFKFLPYCAHQKPTPGEDCEGTLDLALLRTCKQIHRECKEIIWRRNGLYLRQTPIFYYKLQGFVPWFGPKIKELRINLELLDGDELDWIMRSMRAFATEKCRKHSPDRIRLIAVPDRPRTLQEFKEFLKLTKYGEKVDGRLYSQTMVGESGCEGAILCINTGWPRFSSWAKQRWLRQMLLDSTNCETLLREIHDIFCGELYVDDVLYYRDHVRMVEAFALDAREGEILICPRKFSSLAPINAIGL